MLTFTPAVQEDLEAVFQLNKQLIDDYEDLSSIDYNAVLNWVYHNIEKNLASFTRVLWNGRTAGYFCLMPSGDKLELDSLFVLPEFRNRGIGTAILKTCQQNASSPVFLYVFRRNTGAVALYERMGFRVVKKAGTTRYIMEYQNQGC